jgi:hypothetical protein
MAEVLAKGPNFVFAREFIQERYGLDTWRRMLESIGPDDAAVWRNADLDQAHPFSSFKSGIQALSNELGSPEMVEISEMYEYIADRSLSTLYKAFFRLTSPQFVIKSYPRLWERFFTAGTVRVPSSDKDHAVVSFTLPGTFLDWLPPACLGYSQKAVSMAGGKHFTMRQTEMNQLANDLWEISYKLAWR